MKIDILEDKNNLKGKQKFLNDKYMNTLIDYFISNINVEGLNSFIRLLFFINKFDDYDLTLNRAKIRFNHSINELNEICNLFKQWTPYEKYNLGECMGAFLEILSYELIKLEYPTHTVKQEVNLFIEGYKSHTWDILLKRQSICELFECKFSAISLKRKHLNQMIGDYNKIKLFQMCLIFFSNRNKVLDRLELLQENTNINKYQLMIDKFNLITLENFSTEQIF